MKRRSAMGAGAIVCAIAVTLWAATTQSLAAPGTPSASASVSARPSAAPKAPPPEPKTLASLSIPGEKSPLPKAAEWVNAQPVRLDRVTAATRSCSALVLREYMKVTCTTAMVGVRQFAGGIDDVQVAVTPKAMPHEVFMPPLGGFVVFPLRKGQGYVFRFFEAEAGGYGGGLFPAVGPLVDAHWPAGDAAPTVTIR